MRHKRLTTTVAAVTLGAGTALLPADATGALWDLGDTFRAYEIVAMEPTLTKADLADGRIVLSLLGEVYDLRVADLPGYAPLTVTRLSADGSAVVEPPAFESVAVTGSDAARPDLDALLLVDAPGVGGYVSAGDGTIALQPLSLLRPGAPAGLTVVYRTRDVLNPVPLENDYVDVPAPPGMDQPDRPVVAEGWAAPDRRVTLWADSQMAAQGGFTTTISNAFWTMATQYNSTASGHPGWTYSLVNNTIYTCHDTACDTAWGMTSWDAGTLLSQWGTQVPNNAAVGTAFDNAALATGKDFTGSLIGLAYQPGRYSVNQLPGQASWTQALLLGHEIGHNYNGDHGNRGIASPGRATSYTHNHPSNHCHLGPVAGTCLQNHVHDNYYTHYSLMWPTLYGNSGTAEQSFELGSTNQSWMQACNNNSFSSGSYSPGNAGFGWYCLN